MSKLDAKEMVFVFSVGRALEYAKSSGIKIIYKPAQLSYFFAAVIAHGVNHR